MTEQITDIEGVVDGATTEEAAASRPSKVQRLEHEGDIAADYLEELLDIADLDGDIDMDVEGDRASVQIGGADLSLLVAEHAGMLRAVSSAYTQTLGGGVARELYVRGETLSVFVQPIGSDFFLLLALDGRSNLGQARLYGRDAARRLEAQL